ncbi:MAG: tetratricopeptide repeat protein [Blautia sp.]|nr:tetratricopeptide repeat protein [Blautia sp.]
MKCPYCHEEQEGSVNFCMYCGSVLPKEDSEPKKSRKPLIIIASAVAAVAVVVFFVVALSVFGRTDEERLQRQLELGERYLSEMNYERALAAYTAAIEIEPQNIEATCGMARAYAGLDDYEQAENVLLSLIETLEQDDYRKKQEELYATLADIYLESGDSDSAWSAIQRGTDRAAREDILLNSLDPMKRDTDGDGLFDGTELQNGFDPNLRDTDGDGVPDGREEFGRVVSMPSAIPQEDQIYPVVWAEGQGEAYGDFDAVYLRNNVTLRGIGSVRGIPCEFSGQSDMEQVRIGFCVPEALASDTSGNLQVAGYDYEQNRLVLHDTSIESADDGSVLVLSDTAEAGTYMLVDWERLKRDTDATEFSSIVESGKADVVFVIDTTGSMSGPISNVEENIVDFSQYLADLGVDVRVGIVEYKDIYEDGSGSTVDHGFYYDLDEFRRVLGNFRIDGGGDEYETAVDALDVMADMDFRSGVNKFAILVSDTAYKEGTQSNAGYTMEQMIGTLESQNICTSVVTNYYHFDEYRKLTSRTNGELCDIDTDFATSLRGLMDKMGTMVNEGTWVRLTNGSVVCLNEDPTLNNTSIDTDGDGIPDLMELGETITVSYRSSLSGEEVAFEAYTFQSNPALADSDGDGLADDVDARPVQCDMEASALGVPGTYLMVDTADGGSSYGVTGETAMNSGMAAMENMLLYLQKYTGNFWLTGFDPTRESYALSEVRDMADDLENILASQDLLVMETEPDLESTFQKSKKLLKIIKQLYREAGVEENGCIRGGNMEQCLSFCLGGIMTSYYMPFGEYSEGEIYQRICQDIERGYPVMLQTGLAGNVELFDSSDLSGSSVPLGSMEWLTITGYERNGIEGTIVLEVLYDGGMYYLDFRRLMDVDALLGGIVGIDS